MRIVKLWYAGQWIKQNKIVTGDLFAPVPEEIIQEYVDSTGSFRDLKHFYDTYNGDDVHEILSYMERRAVQVDIEL